MSRTPVNFKQIGNSGLSRYGPYIYEEFLPELRWPGAARVYQEMSDNDPVIGSVLFLAEMLIRGVDWRVEPASNAKADEDAAKFLRECMDDMSMSWANTISEILSMLPYGFSFHEQVYKVRRGPNQVSLKYKSKHNDGRIGWRCLPVRAQTTLHSWLFDDEGDVSGFVQQGPPDFKIVTIPMSRGLLFRTKVSRNNPEGRSLLRNAYRPWFFKKHFEEIEGIGIERDLAGFPVLQSPEGINLWDENDPIMVSLKTRAEELVSSIRRDSEEGVVLPPGWDLKLLASSSSRQIDIGETIDRYDNRIAITMLSDIILIGSKQSGSFALADAKQSMLASALQAQLLNIADVFNSKAIPDLFSLNIFNGLSGLPKIVPGSVQTPSLKEIALMLRAMGLNIAGDMQLQNFLRHIMGMPDVTKEEFEQMYRAQLEDKKTVVAGDKDKPDDTVDNDLEQSGEHYTGRGDE